jgi:ferredoxin-NADP reductase
MFTTIVAVFRSESLAAEARKALLAAGVPQQRIAFGASPGELWTVSVGAQSSFEIQRVEDLLRRNGAAFTEQR